MAGPRITHSAPRFIFRMRGRSPPGHRSVGGGARTFPEHKTKFSGCNYVNQLIMQDADGDGEKKNGLRRCRRCRPPAPAVRTTADVQTRTCLPVRERINFVACTRVIFRAANPTPIRTLNRSRNVINSSSLSLLFCPARCANTQNV